MLVTNLILKDLLFCLIIQEFGKQVKKNLASRDFEVR